MLVVGFDVLLGSETERLTPKAVSLAVREREDVDFACDAVEAEFGHYRINY